MVGDGLLLAADGLLMVNDELSKMAIYTAFWLWSLTLALHAICCIWEL